MRATSLIAIAALAGTGCGHGDAEVRRHRLEAERRSLADTLDRLEDRLLVDQSRVRFWQEMRARHESVTAIACVSQGRHAEEMAARFVDPARPDVAARRRPRVVARYLPAEPRGKTADRPAVASRPPPGIGGVGGAD